VCGDSHTCTHGGLGALAFGLGSSDVGHVLATQSLALRRPKTFRVTFEGPLAQGVYAQDMVLHRRAMSRRRCRQWLRRRVRRVDGCEPAGRRPAHVVQHVGGMGCKDRHGRARRYGIRISRRTPLSPKGNVWDKARIGALAIPARASIVR
jgi:hypothetical protein